MDDVKHLATSADPLLACCVCRCLLLEAVQLKCLHNYCRPCFNTAASTDGCQKGIRCNVCSAITQVGREQPNGLIERQVQRYMIIAESRMCGKCKENGESEKSAVVWCPKCRHSFCGDCTDAHRQYYRQHVTQSLDELQSLDEVCSQPSAASCAIHGKPLEIACRNCEQAKCISCWASCQGKKHEVLIIGDESFDSYVGSLVVCITSIESELLRKSEALEKPKSFIRNMKLARDRQMEDLNKRKRRVVDAVETAYHNVSLSMKDTYDRLEAEGEAAIAAAERIASESSDARSYVRRLVESNEKCEILKQQKIVHERLSVLSAEMDTLSNRLATTMKEVKIESSLPEDFENVVRAWIGVPQVYSASSALCQLGQQQCFSFGVSSTNFELPVRCRDIALVQDRCSLLVATSEHGLIEYSPFCGHVLSRWVPTLSGGGVDNVHALAALRDGRAAVSLLSTQLVVLLRRSKQSGCTTAAEGDSWTEDYRFNQLLWPAHFLAAHGDVLSASQSECRPPFPLAYGPGQQVQLLSISSRRPLGNVLWREYFVRSLAVAARVVVTGSWGKVELGGGRRASHVLDAHCLADDGSDKRLWRHVVGDGDKQESVLSSICVDSSGGCLYYATQQKNDPWLSALSLTDGRELRRIALSLYPTAAVQRQSFWLPLQLSLCDEGAAPAAERQQQQQSNSSSSGHRTLLLAARWVSTTDLVSLHRSTSDELH